MKKVREQKLLTSFISMSNNSNTRSKNPRIPRYFYLDCSKPSYKAYFSDNRPSNILFYLEVGGESSLPLISLVSNRDFKINSIVSGVLNSCEKGDNKQKDHKIIDKGIDGKTDKGIDGEIINPCHNIYDDINFNLRRQVSITDRQSQVVNASQRQQVVSYSETNKLDDDKCTNKSNSSSDRINIDNINTLVDGVNVNTLVDGVNVNNLADSVNVNTLAEGVNMNTSIKTDDKLTKIDDENQFKSKVAILKSHLQKCIRKSNPELAVRTALEFMDLDLISFLRRLPIIMIEDCILMLDIAPIVWFLMCLSHKSFSSQFHKSFSSQCYKSSSSQFHKSSSSTSSNRSNNISGSGTSNNCINRPNNNSVNKLVLSREDKNWLCNIVYSMAKCPIFDYVVNDNINADDINDMSNKCDEEDNRKYKSDEKKISNKSISNKSISNKSITTQEVSNYDIISNIKDQEICATLWALKLRKFYGGTKWDMKMISSTIYLWYYTYVRAHEKYLSLSSPIKSTISSTSSSTFPPSIFSPPTVSNSPSSFSPPSSSPSTASNLGLPTVVTDSSMSNVQENKFLFWAQEMPGLNHDVINSYINYYIDNIKALSLFKFNSCSRSEIKINEDSIDKSNAYNKGYKDDKLANWDLTAIDFHCYPKITKLLNEQIPSVTQEMWRKILWNCGSSVTNKCNIGLKRGISDKEKEEMFVIYNKYLFNIQSIQRYVLNRMSL